MSLDPASELATLVADVLSEVEAWRTTGGGLAPVGPLAGLPDAAPWPAGAGVAQTPPARALPQPTAPSRPRAPAAPPPRPVAAAQIPPPSPAALGGGGRAAPSPAPPPRLGSEPSSGAVPRRGEAEPRAGGLGGMFGGKWAVALRDRGEELRTALAGLPVCADCGAAAPVLLGAGKADAPLVVLAVGPGGAALGAEGSGMLDRMLVNVLALERSDVWFLEANACAAGGGGCRIPLRRQIDVVNPRLVLALGRGSGVVLGGPAAAVGEWAPFGGADVMTTFHPLELLTRPAEKRAAMDHLTLLRRRL